MRKTNSQYGVQRIENKAKTSSGNLARVKVINQEVESSKPRLAWSEYFPSGDTWPTQVRGTIHPRWQYEVAKNVRWQYEVATAGQSTRVILRVSDRGRRVSVRGNHMAIMRRLVECKKTKIASDLHQTKDDAEMFDTDALFGNEVFAKNDMIEKDQDVIPKEVSTAAPSTTAVPPPPPVITEVEITLAQTLAKLKSAKSKVVIQEPVQSTATTAPSTIPKAKGITFRDADERTTRTPTSVSSLSIKDKGKAKMDRPEVPLKKNDQIALDEEIG
ncbi:hypothetical protein Tco_0638446 [Tanacetum coccineum]